jgi:hypothetical protein
MTPIYRDPLGIATLSCIAGCVVLVVAGFNRMGWIAYVVHTMGGM